MTDYRIDDMVINPEIQGADQYLKISYPIQYGRFGQIRTQDHQFGFNLNGEIRTIQGRGGGLLQRAEWLKRTDGNDWTYFSAGGYNGAYNYTGEYYVPCLAYKSNAIFGVDRLGGEEVHEAFDAWKGLRERLARADRAPMAPDTSLFVEKILRVTDGDLENRARRFHEIIGGQVSVLPPDCRHVEYDVIPVNVADGCLYNCGFCRVKSGRGFMVRSEKDILDQLHALKHHFGPDLINYNSIFLGQHDALFAGREIIEFAAGKAFEILEIKRSIMKDPRLFLFGSADSLLRAGKALFSMINKLPFATFINIGFESGDSETLKVLQKPLTAEKVGEAFEKMLKINRDYANIEITGNFVIGEDLPESHLTSVEELTRNRMEHFYSKGAIYFSPLENIGAKDRFLTRFNSLKTRCRLPAYIYLIQRL